MSPISSDLWARKRRVSTPIAVPANSNAKKLIPRRRSTPPASPCAARKTETQQNQASHRRDTCTRRRCQRIDRHSAYHSRQFQRSLGASWLAPTPLIETSTSTMHIFSQSLRRNQRWGGCVRSLLASSPSPAVVCGPKEC